MTAIALLALTSRSDLRLEPLRAERRRRVDELATAIRRAERWYAVRQEQLAAAHRRASRTVTTLAAAGAIARR